MPCTSCTPVAAAGAVVDAELAAVTADASRLGELATAVAFAAESLDNARAESELARTTAGVVFHVQVPSSSSVASRRADSSVDGALRAMGGWSRMKVLGFGVKGLGI